jgi:hypothetical protein
MYMQAPDRGFKSYQRDRAKTSIQFSMGRIDREDISTRSCVFIANNCILKRPVWLLSWLIVTQGYINVSLIVIVILLLSVVIDNIDNVL